MAAVDDLDIFDQVNDAIIVTDMEFTIQRWNRGASLLYGWPANEAIGKRVGAIINVKRYLDGGNGDDAVATLRQGGRWRGLVVQLHRDGRELYVESSVQMVRDAAGQAVGVISINRDVTERIELLQREQQARAAAESAARRQQILSDISAAFVATQLNLHDLLTTTVQRVANLVGDLCVVRLLSDDGTMLVPGPLYHSNPRSRKLAASLIQGVSPTSIGMSAEVVRTGEPIVALTTDPVALRQAFHGALESYLQTVGMSSLILVPMRAGQHVVGTLFVSRDDGNRPFEADDLSLVQNIADRAALAIENARLHQASEVTLARLSTVLATAPVGISFWNTDLVYVQLNDAFAALSGRSSATLIGCRITDVPSQLMDAVVPNIQETLRTGEPKIDQEISGALPGTDGRQRFWLYSCYAIRNAAGVIFGVGAVTVEITQRKQLEAQLLLSQRMEGLGRLAGGVAHDFNNLLTAIVGYADMVMTSLPVDDPLIQDVDEIKKAADRATALTRQLLAFARRSVMSPQLVNLNALISDLEKLLRRLIGQQIDLVLRLDTQLTTIHADGGQIEQVLINLVINARDAMPNGGRLVIETSHVDLDARFARRYAGISSGQYVQLVVSDTGVGMDAQTQARVFEPFFTTKSAAQGTGLGLSTCYGIVKQHQGSIWIYSEVGKGTTVRVYLPQAPEGAEPVPTPAPKSVVPQGTETILLVEDDEAIRTVAARALRSYGYTVLETGSGDQAIHLLEVDPPPAIDLLLTDMVLPGPSGRQIATALRERYPHLKLLFTSGYAEDAITYKEAWDVDSAFLPKPFAPASLLRAVRAVLDQSQSA